MLIQGDLTVTVNVEVRYREGYVAARISGLPMIVYGDSEEDAEKRALEGMVLLLQRNMSSPEALQQYLERRGLEYTLETRAVGTTLSSPRKVRVPLSV